MSFKKLLLSTLVLSSSLFADPRDSQGSVEMIHYLIKTKYGPLYYKEQMFGWNLDHSIFALKNSISFSNNPHWLLRKFFLQANDFHLGAYYYSSASATLPFHVKKIQDEIYVVMADSNIDLNVGDQILYIDGVSALSIFNHFKMDEMIGTVESHSSDAMTELYFTKRYGEIGHKIPRGDVQIIYMSPDSPELKATTLTWSMSDEYYPFKVPFEKPKKNFSLEIVPALESQPLIEKVAILPNHIRSLTPSEAKSYSLTSKRGFLPYLGRVLSDFKKAPFFYYIYETPEGNTVGFLRIGTFEFDIADLSHLKKTLNLFEKNTDALIIDITHNPGGEVLKAFAVISYLINEPIDNYENTEILTSEEVHYAVTFKYFLEGAEDEKEMQRVLKKMSCYNPGPILGHQFLSYANFLIESWENGNRMTALFPINGIDKIYPDKTCHYTKPILIITDHLSISCADFFPGLLQDSGRAEVMGQRTAGAGGFIFPAISFPNQLGIEKILITNSMVFRTNGAMLENYGIEPLNPYEYTVEDILTDYKPYKAAINEKIDSMIR